MSRDEELITTWAIHSRIHPYLLAVVTSLLLVVIADPMGSTPVSQLPALTPQLEKQLRKAVQENPQSAAAWADLGDLELALQRPAEAERALRQAIRLDPRSARAFNLLGLVLAGRKEGLAEAETSFRRSITLDPKQADPWINLGHLQQDQLQRFSEAEKSYRRAIELDSGASLAWNGLGNLLVRLDRPQEAVIAFRRAMAKDPENLLPYENLAQAQRVVLKDLVGAEQTYREILRQDPNHFRTLYNLSFLLAERGDYAGAEKACLTTLRVDDSDPAIWALLADLLRSDPARQSEAEAAIRKTIELDPARVRNWLILGELIFEDRERRPAEAEKVFRSLIKLDPGSVQGWNWLGAVLHWPLNRRDEAEKAFRKAIELAPEDPIPRRNLDRLLNEKPNGPKGRSR